MIFVAIGFAAGVLAGVFGIGGGIIIVPALIAFAGFTPQLATGTSLAALLLPVGALGAWQYWRHGDVGLSAALWIALGLAVGAYLGARIGVPMNPRTLQRSFAVFLAAVAVWTWWRA